MKIYTLKMVSRHHLTRGQFFFKDFPAGSDNHAYQQARQLFPLSKFDIFIERVREETDYEKRKKYFDAVINRQCMDCG